MEGEFLERSNCSAEKVLETSQKGFHNDGQYNETHPDLGLIHVGGKVRHDDFLRVLSNSLCRIRDSGTGACALGRSGDGFAQNLSASGGAARARATATSLGLSLDDL